MVIHFKTMFIPATRQEIEALGWDKPDIILVTGDAYIDSPHTGVAVIGKCLMAAGYKVGIIAQPNVSDDTDIKRLGEPALFWGVTSGCVDSMVANYTATKKKRNEDDFTPGLQNVRRPDRAVIAYSNLIRRYFKNTKPIVLGGIEASLRRISHYDFWDDAVRKSVLFDAKADFLVYGMGEKAIIELAGKLKKGESPSEVRGICHISKGPVDGYIILPSHDEVSPKTPEGRDKFAEMFGIFYANNEPHSAKGLCQKQDTRYIVQNPPQYDLTVEELDAIYAQDYERDVHPIHKKEGAVRALETIKFSITTHRGCYGECNFCSVSAHQGAAVTSRSAASIIEEARKISALPDFKGYITDVGGPTANMYATHCNRAVTRGRCKDKRCLYPSICGSLKFGHGAQIKLLSELRALPGIKKVFVASGIRHDMALADKERGVEYVDALVSHHVSGQMKIAPEHTEPAVLKRMGKPGPEYLKNFKKLFDELNKRRGKNQFLTYYFIAAHPGCGIYEMKKLKDFAASELKMTPEQIQIFTPTPSTYSTLMYYTGKDPFTGEEIFTERDPGKRGEQKQVIIYTRRREPVRRGGSFRRNK